MDASETSAVSPIPDRLHTVIPVWLSGMVLPRSPSTAGRSAPRSWVMIRWAER